MSSAYVVGTGFTISEVAEQTGLTTHALRYYERGGLMIDSVNRSSSGHQRYSAEDIQWITFITKLRSTGMPIRDVRKYADLVRSGNGNEAQRLALLSAHRKRVRQQQVEIGEQLSAIDYKIDLYQDTLNAPLDLERARSS